MDPLLTLGNKYKKYTAIHPCKSCCSFQRFHLLLNNIESSISIHVYLQTYLKENILSYNINNKLLKGFLKQFCLERRVNQVTKPSQSRNFFKNQFLNQLKFQTLLVCTRQLMNLQGWSKEYKCCLLKQTNLAYNVTDWRTLRQPDVIYI